LSEGEISTNVNIFGLERIPFRSSRNGALDSIVCRVSYPKTASHFFPNRSRAFGNMMTNDGISAPLPQVNTQILRGAFASKTQHFRV